jgi:RimJ/RimL family protein N-acetyltransferase
MLILDQRVRCGDWAKERIEGVQSWGTLYEAIGWEQDGQLTAVVVYDHWSGPDVNMHIAALPGCRWMRRLYLRTVFQYPFLKLGTRRVTANVASLNNPCVRFCLHIGFKLEGIKRDGWHGDDMLVLGMTRAECRYL